MTAARFCTLFIAVVISGVVLTSTSQAVPTNGDFSIPDLSGWIRVSGIVREKEEDRGYAYFEEAFDIDTRMPVMSLLTQEFILPAGALELSFEFRMNSNSNPGTEIFTASLFDPATNLPLIWYDTETYFYYLDSDGVQHTDADVVKYPDDVNEVTLNVSSLAPNQKVRLEFGFLGMDDFTITTISLDNVKVSAIPAPGAMALVGIGCGIVGLLRRAKKL